MKTKIVMSLAILLLCLWGARLQLQINTLKTNDLAQQTAIAENARLTHLCMNVIRDLAHLQQEIISNMTLLQMAIEPRDWIEVNHLMNQRYGEKG